MIQTYDDALQGTPGLETPAIKNKLALRASLTGSIFMDNVKIPKENMLPGVHGLKGPFSCLNSARYGIGWGVMGSLEDCIARAREYGLERSVPAVRPVSKPSDERLTRNVRYRKQFNRPLASFQLVQKKIADASTEATLGILGSLQLGRMKDAGTWNPEMVSMMKRNNCGKALEHSRRLLDVLGGNACSDE